MHCNMPNWLYNSVNWILMYEPEEKSRVIEKKKGKDTTAHKLNQIIPSWGSCRWTFHFGGKNTRVVVGVRGPEVKYAAAGQSSQSLQVEVLPRNNECYKRYCLSCNTLHFWSFAETSFILACALWSLVKCLLENQVMHRFFWGIAQKLNVAK